MDEHVGKALDHLMKHKLPFAHGYMLKEVQRNIGAHGVVQMAHVAVGSSHVQVCSLQVHVRQWALHASTLQDAFQHSQICNGAALRRGDHAECAG
jgi:hypothetical protein